MIGLTNIRKISHERACSVEAISWVADYGWRWSFLRLNFLNSCAWCEPRLWILKIGRLSLFPTSYLESLSNKLPWMLDLANKRGKPVLVAKTGLPKRAKVSRHKAYSSYPIFLICQDFPFLGRTSLRWNFAEPFRYSADKGHGFTHWTNLMDVGKAEKRSDICHGLSQRMSSNRCFDPFIWRRSQSYKRSERDPFPCLEKR